MKIVIAETAPIGRFTWRWPEEREEFDRGWDIIVHLDGRRKPVRHGICRRFRYGRLRVSTVTWVAGVPSVEGVEADDYDQSRSLLSILKLPNKCHVRATKDIPPGYEGFTVVNHRAEIDAPYSPNSLALKIVEDDLAAWATHAVIRARQRQEIKANA